MRNLKIPKFVGMSKRQFDFQFVSFALHYQLRQLDLQCDLFLCKPTNYLFAHEKKMLKSFSCYGTWTKPHREFKTLLKEREKRNISWDSRKNKNLKEEGGFAMSWCSSILNSTHTFLFLVTQRSQSFVCLCVCFSSKNLFRSLRLLSPNFKKCRDIFVRWNEK